MDPQFTDAELLGYLDEALDPERMSRIEGVLRDSAPLRSRAAELQRTRHQGHTISEIWQRGRLSCPSREQLALFLRNQLDLAWTDYIEFHVRKVGCRYCLANLSDLQPAAAAETVQRQRKVFQSSAGKLRRD